MRIKHVFFLAVLLLAALSLCACGGKASESEPIDLSSNPDSASGSGWTWEGGVDRTLTLTSARLTFQGDYGFRLPEGAVICCTSGTQNAITVNSGKTAVGILADGRLSLRGSGSLEMKVSANEEIVGISVTNGELIYDNMTLSVSAGDGTARSQGIAVGKRAVLTNAVLSASSSVCLSVGGDMTASSSTLSLSGGQTGEAALDVGGELELTNVTLSVSSQGTGICLDELETTASTVSIAGGEYALYARGDVKIGSGKLELSGNQGALLVENGQLELGRGVNITEPEGGVFDGRTVTDAAGAASTKVTIYKKP